MCRVTDGSLREAVSRLRAGRSLGDVAAEIGMSKSAVHRFLTGERPIRANEMYQALYRAYPELRDLLDAHQREQALAGGTAVGQRRD